MSNVTRADEISLIFLGETHCAYIVMDSKDVLNVSRLSTFKIMWLSKLPTLTLLVTKAWLLLLWYLSC